MPPHPTLGSWGAVNTGLKMVILAVVAADVDDALAPTTSQVRDYTHNAAFEKWLHTVSQGCMDDFKPDIFVARSNLRDKARPAGVPNFVSPRR